MGRSEVVVDTGMVWLMTMQFLVRVCKSSVFIGHHGPRCSHWVEERTPCMLIKGDDTAQRNTLMASDACTNKARRISIVGSSIDGADL